MTQTDIRYMYKRETGEFPFLIIDSIEYTIIPDFGPFYTEVKEIKKKTYGPNGKPRRKYAAWLEDKLENNNRKLRESYYNKEKTRPTKSFFKGMDPRKEKYLDDYVYWMEDLFLKTH